MVIKKEFRIIETRIVLSGEMVAFGIAVDKSSIPKKRRWIISGKT
jgi:hypothetical protein